MNKKWFQNQIIGKWSLYSEAHLHGVTNPFSKEFYSLEQKEIYYFIKEHGIVLQSIVYFPLKQYQYLCHKLVKYHLTELLYYFLGVVLK